jgi:glycosyltransferase involved in cell wall biosynthesis
MPNASLFTVLYAGAHGDANALDNVIEAARLLEQDMKSSIRFVFVGDGPEKQALILQAEGLSNVHFENPVPKSQIPALMAKADAILLSLRDVPLFRYGVSPNKLYDAYALGRPVITTVAGAINEEVEEHRLGVTAVPGDPQALAIAIQNLASTPHNEREAMAHRARRLAETTYSRQRINARYDELLREVIAA